MSEKELTCKYTNFIDENPKKMYVEQLAREISNIDLSDVRRQTTEKAYSAHNVYGKVENDHEEMMSEIVEF
jgi:hypothetical protein